MSYYSEPFFIFSTSTSVNPERYFRTVSSSPCQSGYVLQASAFSQFCPASRHATGASVPSVRQRIS